MKKEETTGLRIYRIQGKETVPVSKWKVPSLRRIAKDDRTHIRVLNFGCPEKSMRFNPVQHRYLPTLLDCNRLASEIIWQPYAENFFAGKEVFWAQSCMNMLTAAIHFFVNYKRLPYDKNGTLLVPVYKEDPETHYRRLTMRALDDTGNFVEPSYWLGRYSDLPHVLSFLSRDYRDIFEILETDAETYPLILPFITAYNNKAMDQLEGMVATLRVILGQIATKETFWILHKDGDEFTLRDGGTDYLAVVTEGFPTWGAAILNALVTGTKPSTYQIRKKGNATAERILEYESYAFPSEAVKEDILIENYNRVNKDISDMINEITHEYGNNM